MEYAFVVRCAGGYGEVRVRNSGEVVVTAGSTEWVVLDGISFPSEDYAHRPGPPRLDVARINAADLGRNHEQQTLLFHYPRSPTALDYILKDGRLRMSPYSTTNDPRESKEWLFALYCGTESAPAGASITISMQLSAELKRDCRLSCFCSESVPRVAGPALPASTAWGRARMWAQYGDSHRGVVLVFNQDALLRNAATALDSRGSIYYGPVEYSRPRDAGDMHAFLIDYDRWRSIPVGQYASEHLAQHRAWLFFTKHADWLQESEGRLVLYSNTPGDAYVPIVGALMEVCIGDSFPDARLEECRRLAGEHGASVSRITWRNGTAIRVPA